MVTLKPIKLLPARERVASALRKAIISKQIGEGEVIRHWRKKIPAVILTITSPSTMRSGQQQEMKS